MKDVDTAGSAEAQTQIAEQQRRIEALEARILRLDARAHELENEVVRRGVKLSCANVALARAKIAFDETSRAREDAVQDIAHDLRTPLTSIKGATQNLLDGLVDPLSPGVHEYVDIIHSQADRLIDVVNWLVDALRLTTGPVDLEGEPVDLGSLTAETVRGLSPIAAERGIKLTVETCDARAQADEAKLRQVLENLIGNALKFTEPGGQVHVSLAQDGTGYRIHVKDSGCGMDPEALERIFDRYFRKHKGAQGKGLGLLIAREITRKHGGDITVRSKLGHGSEFIIHLPPR